MENVSFSMELPVPDLDMRAIEHISENSDSQHFSEPTDQVGLIDANPFNPMFNTSDLSSNEVSNYESSGGSGFSPAWISAELLNEDESILNSISGHGKALPVKRKAAMGLNSYNFVSEQQIFPNKRSVYISDGLSSSGVLQQPAPLRTGPASPNTGFPALHTQSTIKKKPVLADAVDDKSELQRVQPVKRQSTQRQSASKFKQDSSETVRSKMRESLAAALALTSQNSEKDLVSKKDQGDGTLTEKVSRDLTASGPTPTTGGNVPASGANSNVIALDGGGTFPEFQYTSMLVDEDPQFSDSFFVKDDLLQGNGLSWAFELDAQMNGGKGAQCVDYEDSISCEANDQREFVAFVENLIPEDVAFEIEAELFKLFDGVNKKYKEKGRSLLFNLKDRNNPELRERVMTGEISPERLCLMSAEELASKELSEWRMAKAEELAQMKVLPDTEVDIRRLVRKTHKGEYQVELEHDENIVADVSGGTSILTQPQSKKAPESTSPPKPSVKSEDDNQVNVPENHHSSSTLVIPADGADLMQKMMVDELKDPAPLPPIVSFDEFMESLNSEPPFENLSSNADQKTSISREKSKISSKTSRSPDSSSLKLSNSAKSHEAKPKTGGSHEQKVSSSILDDQSDYIWEGVLQFNTSSSVKVCALFQSGEKTPTKPWPSSLDIKGRVRLGAFEKFLQELPLSRTRAVMVLKLVLKDKASTAQLSSLKEAIESYSGEERLGYAEPAPGVEIYLCPRTPKVSEMVKHYYTPKDSSESIEEGLIGVVVWRKANKSSSSNSKVMSPHSSSSHHKHRSSKKESLIRNKPQKDTSNVTKTSAPPPPLPSPLNDVADDDDGDDVPPGFGPGSVVVKEEDDLPEFNFSGISHHQAQRNVDKVRELIQKYGQSGGTGSSKSSVWDDDDDIPEWQPQGVTPVQYGVAAMTAAEGVLPPPPAEGVVPWPQHGVRWRPY